MPTWFEAAADFAERNFLSASDIGVHYDIAVIGSGPAGALTALLAARAGRSVLLIERQPLPRYKVCGCCLSPHSLNILHECGLDNLVDDLGAPQLTTLIAANQCRRVAIPLPGFRAVSRSRLDLALTAAAMQVGASCLPATAAKVVPAGEQDRHVTIELSSHDTTNSLTADLVVAADGLAGTCLAGFESMQADITADSRIGVAAVSLQAPDFYERGSIYMACSDVGYVGLVRLEDDTTEIAAALNAGCLKFASSSQVIASILASCSFPLPADLAELHFKGTAPLTRRRTSVADRRLFVIGDAASYAEPFTGEGIAWALKSAQLLAPMAVRAAGQWDDAYVWRWQHTYRRSVQARQRTTKSIASLLRQPALLDFAAAAIQFVPGLAKGLSHAVCGQQPASAETGGDRWFP